MARVYRGFDRSLQRPVAVKILRPELATARAAERFLREARLLARLSHPNIVPVHEVGEADGLFYYVMDFVAGETLRERLARGSMTHAETVRMGMDVLQALGAAHARGVIHRDLKPANVFVNPDRALLADFGVAKTSSSSGEALTDIGERPGTPGYMAPEQALGQKTTPRSDLYAAGMLLYEALTGRRWSAFEDPDGGDWNGVPSPTARVLRRALARAPEDRWRDARAFRQALLRLDAGGLATTGARARRAVVALSIAGLGAAVAGGALLLGRVTAGHAGDGEPSPVRSYDLALLPCETVPAADSTTGEDLARLATIGLEGLPMLQLVPFNTAARWWRTARASEDVVPIAAAARALRARRVVRCWTVGRDGEQREVRLELVDEEGESLPLRVIRGPGIHSSYELGDSVAVEILRGILPEQALSRDALTSLSGHDVQAVRAFLLGEHAFLANDRHRAERFYQAAAEADPSLVIARWRLADVRRWLAVPPGIDLRELHAGHADDLPRMARLLLEAALATPGPEQFVRYEEVLRLYPHDGYAALIYGDELFHRGPLWGIPLDSAIRVLTIATQLDPYLAPAWEHLMYAEIRSGRRERAEEALRRYRELVAGATTTTPLDLFHPAILELAFLERFEPDSARGVRAHLFAAGTPGGRDVLAAGARFSGPYLDLPETQLALGRQLAAGGAGGPSVRTTAFLTQAVALLTLGRQREGLAWLDSASRSGDVVSTVQAAEWRTLPAALGLGGTPPADVEAGRAALERLAAERELAVVPRIRAAWALAVLAARAGEEEEFRHWRAVVAADSAEAGSLLRILDALATGAMGDRRGGVLALRPFAVVDSADRVRYPFVRSVVHLARGQWLFELGAADSALAVWRWHEASHLDGIPGASLHAGEVDWALSTHARSLGAGAALTAGRRDEACTLIQDALRRWEGADSGLESEVEQARATRAAACPAGRAP